MKKKYKKYIFKGINNMLIRVTVYENGNIIIDSGLYKAKADKVVWYYEGQIKL